MGGSKNVKGHHMYTSCSTPPMLIVTVFTSLNWGVREVEFMLAAVSDVLAGLSLLLQPRYTF